MGEDVSKEKRELLQATIDDSVSNLLYYNRKEDDELPLGAIEELVSKGEVTITEMIEWFAEPLRRHLTKATGRKT